MGLNSKLLGLLFKDFYNHPLQVPQASVTVDDSQSPKHVLPSSNALPFFAQAVPLPEIAFAPSPPSPMLAHKRPAPPTERINSSLLSPRSLRSPKVNLSFPLTFYMSLSEHLTNWMRALFTDLFLFCLLDSEDFESLIKQIWFISEIPEVMSFTECTSKKMY